ncbi:VOC family protein [Arthrobacter nitrophenolicus]|uniref:VOC family protein n=1 Tax=Arthrobacter nitrophenolicus TaxID=683150 RepID=UPI00389A04EC
MSGEPVFFELGVEDAERGKRFYGELFGWTLSPGPSGAGFSIGTAGIPGGIHGGDRGASPYLFFRVDNLDEALARVRDLGGSVDETDLGESESTVAEYGRFKLCRDDQGSAFGLHEPPAK